MEDTNDPQARCRGAGSSAESAARPHAPQHGGGYTRNLIPLAGCGLLSRRNARRYCGCLGEESFDREVGPHVRPRLLRSRRFYSRKELDAWIDGLGQPSKESFREHVRRVFEEEAAREREVTGIVLGALRDAKRPCSTRELALHVMAARGMDVADKRLVRSMIARMRARLIWHYRGKEIVRSASGPGDQLAWEIAS
jgi:hypothetical protein